MKNLKIEIGTLLATETFDYLCADQKFFVVSFLRFDVPFLRMYDNKTISSIFKVMKLQEYKEGEIIFTMGDDAKYLYIIATGKVGIYLDLEC